MSELVFESAASLVAAMHRGKLSAEELMHIFQQAQTFGEMQDNTEVEENLLDALDAVFAWAGHPVAAGKGHGLSPRMVGRQLARDARRAQTGNARGVYWPEAALQALTPMRGIKARLRAAAQRPTAPRAGAFATSKPAQSLKYLAR